MDTDDYQTALCMKRSEALLTASCVSLDSSVEIGGVVPVPIPRPVEREMRLSRAHSYIPSYKHYLPLTAGHIEGQNNIFHGPVSGHV